MRWRLGERQAKFAREVGGIVLGVLIALAIGEIADALRWQARVGNSLAAVREELAGNRFNLAERSLAQPCIERRLAAIGAILAAARRTHVLPDVAGIGSPGRRPIESAAFEVAKSEGVPLHMPHDDARDMALAYLLAADTHAAETEQERQAWTTLRLIEHAPGPVDGDLLATMLQAWTEARSRAAAIVPLARQGDALLAAHRLPVEWGSYGDRAGLVRYWRATAFCRPLRVDGGAPAGG